MNPRVLLYVTLAYSTTSLVYSTREDMSSDEPDFMDIQQNTAVKNTSPLTQTGLVHMIRL